MSRYRLMLGDRVWSLLGPDGDIIFSVPENNTDVTALELLVGRANARLDSLDFTRANLEDRT